MEHPTIIKAFENAEKRKATDSILLSLLHAPIRTNAEPVIYITFKREGIFYKDSYYNLIGTKEEVCKKIKQMYLNVEEEKREHERADGIEDLDTPFDSWCNEQCIYKRMRICNDATKVKCSSHWTHVEHASREELEDYISKIKPGYYPNFSVDLM